MLQYSHLICVPSEKNDRKNGREKNEGKPKNNWKAGRISKEEEEERMNREKKEE